jgi:hypothetical protein
MFFHPKSQWLKIIYSFLNKFSDFCDSNNHMQKFIIYISLFFIVTSCGGSTETKQKKELEKLARGIWEVHDRSMPDHGKLFGYKKKLLALQANTKDSLAEKEISRCILNIEKADIEMTDWMHQYKEPDEFLPFEEKKAYYIKQKEFIVAIENFTNQTIMEAKELIQKYPKAE